MAVLVLNGGSSSWKIALYDDVAADARPRSEPLAQAALEWDEPADPTDARLTLAAPGAASSRSQRVRVGRSADAVGVACKALRAAGADLDALRAVGHRIVHGGNRFSGSVRIDDAVEDGLRALEPLAPSHNALERAGIDAARALFAGVPQVAAFDTTFHRTLPPVARTYPGPYAWLERDLRRFGFHGLSVAYCAERAPQLLGHDLPATDLIVAHLGGGASVTAVHGGASVDTSMGFTPLDGTMMGSRSGAVDPGLLVFLAREAATAGESAAAVADGLDTMLNRQSGLLGISGLSSDVRALEAAAAAGHERAALALDLFARRAAVTIAGMMVSLGRLDALVFTGGIGEHAAAMRARICAPLRFLGIDLAPAANGAHAGEGRIDASGPPVLVVQTCEDWYVARECARVLA